MKKIIALLLTALMVMSFAACSQNEDAEGFSEVNKSETGGEVTLKGDDTKIEELLNSFWKYRYYGFQDRYADGYGALVSSEVNEYGVVVKRIYTWKSVSYNPADNTLVIKSLSSDGIEEGEGTTIVFNEKNQPVSGDMYVFNYDEAGVLISRKNYRSEYTYEYSDDMKTKKEYVGGQLSCVYNYDDNGYLIGLTMYDKYGDRLTEIAYENDAQGRRLKTYSVSKTGEIESTTETRTYDENGNLVSLYN